MHEYKISSSSMATILADSKVYMRVPVNKMVVVFITLHGSTSNFPIKVGTEFLSVVLLLSSGDGAVLPRTTCSRIVSSYRSRVILATGIARSLSTGIILMVHETKMDRGPTTMVKMCGDLITSRLRIVSRIGTRLNLCSPHLLRVHHGLSMVQTSWCGIPIWTSMTYRRIHSVLMIHGSVKLLEYILLRQIKCSEKFLLASQTKPYIRNKSPRYPIPGSWALFYLGLWETSDCNPSLAWTQYA